jgi:hypothetical protein
MTWRDVLLMWLGFTISFPVRALIKLVSDLTFRWRSARGWDRYFAKLEREDMRSINDYLYKVGSESAPKETTIMRWKIKLWGITWDDGKGEYDVSELPRNLEITVNAEQEAEAIEYAMSEASQDYGSLISGVHTTEVQMLPERPVRRDDLD